MDGGVANLRRGRFFRSSVRPRFGSFTSTAITAELARVAVESHCMRCISGTACGARSTLAHRLAKHHSLPGNPPGTSGKGPATAASQLESDLLRSISCFRQSWRQHRECSFGEIGSCGSFRRSQFSRDSSDRDTRREAIKLVKNRFAELGTGRKRFSTNYEPTFSKHGHPRRCESRLILDQTTTNRYREAFS
jgi:hypothetical protein